VNKFPIASL